MVKDGVLGVVGDVLGNQALHGGYHGHVVVGVGLGDQGVYLAAHIGPVIFTDTGDADLFVERRLRRLRLAQDLLVELLPVPQAGVLDLHAASPRSARSCDAPGRRCAPACPCRRRRSRRPRRFVPASRTSSQASGISMKYLMMLGSVTVTGPPALIWRSKIGITEPLEPKTLPKRVVMNWVCPLHHAVALRLVEALHVDLAYSFAASHHVRRVHSLVGGHHHEAANAVFDRKVGQDLRAEDVVLDALARVVLHHRHVLVRRGVEDIFRKRRF